MKSKKGFTLIELLAVIVVIAIISLIAMPLILDVITKVQIGAYKESVRSVFSATDIYLATSGFGKLPDEGINVTDANLLIKNKDFVTGRIFTNAEGKLEVEKVGNDKYCASGTIDNLIVVEGSCDSLDITPPNLSVALGVITSNSVTVAATGSDEESGIRGYQYSSDNGTTWTSEQTESSYTFTGLTMNTSYNIRVRVYNNNDLVTTASELVATTNEITAPSYSATPTGWSQSKVVTISYPTRQEGYVYEYSLDSGSTWQLIASPDVTKDLTFNANGSVIARITDGTNIINGAMFDITNIDTTVPVITVNPTTLMVGVGSSYTNSGVTATDTEMGDITSNIVTTGSVNTNVAGTYTLTYNVSDAAGNAATEKTRTVTVVQATYTYSYTGSYQTLTVPYTGTYKLEVWGAEGGPYAAAGGKGGYSKGNISVSSGQQLYIYVGQKGESGRNGGWNGGGTGDYYSEGAGGTGGGATDIRYGGTALGNRVIVAGGGGGGGYASSSYVGGAGGGASGVAGVGSNYGGGGTQSSGGTSSCGVGTLGVGGSCTLGGYGGAGGGGGGYYGGGSGYYSTGGGGGSGYIGGVTSGQTIAGNGTIPNPSGGTETGHTGNGYAKITFISQ